MVRHFIMILNAKTGELIHGETTTRRGEWISIFFGMVKEIYKLGLQDMVEIVHVGTEKHGKTFFKDDIEHIGRMLADECETITPKYRPEIHQP